VRSGRRPTETGEYGRSEKSRRAAGTEVYTSCSLNYLPKARTLAYSIREQSPDARVTLIFNDMVPSFVDFGSEPFDAVWTPQGLGYDNKWIFQHNVMELCTAVKGRALLRLMQERSASLIIYLDPDCVVYHPLEALNEYMGDSSIGLVPHILQPEETDLGIELTEMSVTEHGIFNLGHLLVRPTKIGTAFAKWWAARLDSYCFDDKERGLFTDQRWVDLVPAIFDDVKIIREPNVDVASWNLSHRIIEGSKSSQYHVNGQPLITFHFSGSGPSGTNRRIREIFSPTSGAAAELEREYETAIARNGQLELESWSCGYDFFDNGVPITAEARKTYRRHPDLQEAFSDPFATSSPQQQTYQRWLREHRPGAITGIRIDQSRMEWAFLNLFDTSFYVSSYPDAEDAVRGNASDAAVAHYVLYGSQLLYDPCELFIANYYFERAKYYEPQLFYPSDSVNGTLLWHYLTVGLPNGIEPLPYFDSAWYLQKYQDIRHAFLGGQISCPLAHYLMAGAKEGRWPSASFDPDKYLAGNKRARELIEHDQTVLGPLGARLRLEGFSARSVF